MSLVKPRGEESWTDAVKNYRGYIQKKGNSLWVYGKSKHSSTTSEQSTKKKTKTEEVMEKIKEGSKRSLLVSQYPSLVNQITRLMFLRPPRTRPTKALYNHGPAGTGKSSAVFKALDACKKVQPKFSYYSKIGGLSKWWDGYDNDPVVVIDDPAVFNVKFNQDEVVYFKNLISTGPMEVEVKCGAMQMDSPLIMLTSNIQPDTLATSAGACHEDAVYDRLAGSRSIAREAIYIQDKKQARDRLPIYIAKLVVRMMFTMYDMPIHLDQVISHLTHTDWSNAFQDIKF